MGALYRSEEMAHCQVFLQSDAAYSCVAELGEIGTVQFLDLNPDVTPYQRKFVNEVRRCDEMERILRYFEKEIINDKSIKMLDLQDEPAVPPLKEMLELEANLHKMENNLREIITNEEQLMKNHLELSELKNVLRATESFFTAGHAPTPADVVEMSEAMGQEGPQMPRFGSPVKLSYITGILNRERLQAFEMMLWRACRGIVLLKYADIAEVLEVLPTGRPVPKVVFIIFFQGEQLKAKVRKICDGFKAKMYACPESSDERIGMATGIMARLEELSNVLNQSKNYRRNILTTAAKDLRTWWTQVRKIKATYHTLNCFNLDVTQKCFIAECWTPICHIDKLYLALKKGTDKSGSSVPSFVQKMDTHEQPPTYFRTNKFTVGFQQIVDAYGVASYQEINPAPYTIISFPFLFGIMFGDIGHGLLMFSFALAFILLEKKLIAARIKDEIFSTFFGGRYIILLMGIFSIYTGLIYNDIFSRSFNIFGSGWRMNERSYNELSGDREKIILDPNTTNFQYNYPYPFGLDPIWQLAENKLLFQNSFKMKMSVIIGIFQMIFGVVLSLLNHLKFKQYLNIWCEFIPEMLFLFCIFFYLCITIFYKWTHFGAWGYGSGVFKYAGPHCAPSLLIGLINMVMFADRQRGLNPGEGDGSTDCYLHTYYPGQTELEHALIIIAVLSIPCMLVIKPFVLRAQHKKKVLDQEGKTQLLRHKSAETSIEMEMQQGEKVNKVAAAAHGGGHGGGGHGHGHGDEFSMGDVFIHQAIHTIEFCLGCVSHTASYLRLWALSLAHAELSEVLWNMVLSNAFAMSSSNLTGCIACYFIFIAFAILTVAILVVMEGLSAFLHALRLHWVEFNSKFYKGDGYAFTPFAFTTILEEARAKEEAEL